MALEANSRGVAAAVWALAAPSPSPAESSTLGGGRVEVWAKRDDCNSGLAYGGNKTRKLEYLAADALAQGCDTLVSIGGCAVEPHPR